MLLREKLLKQEAFDYDEHYGAENMELGWWVTKEQVYDKALFMRKNGLYIIGQKKPQAATPHSLFYRNTINAKNQWSAKAKRQFDNTERIDTCRVLYKFLFSQSPPKPVKKERKKKRGRPRKAPAAAVPVKPKETAPRFDDGFQLCELLRALPAIDHDTYKTCVAYFAYRGLDPSKTESACNAVWKPAADQQGETSRFMKRIIEGGDYKVRKKEMLKMLKDQGIPQRTIDKIFKPRTVFLYDLHKFCNKVINEDDLRQAYMEAVCMIGVGSKTRFRWYECYNGMVQTAMDKQAPLGGKYDAFTYFVKDGDKLVKKNTRKLIGEITEKRELQLFHKIDFIPCAPNGPNRCPENVLNEWNGFQMLLYQPRKQHECEGDIIDQFFTEVYGEQQKKFLLDLFAFYIKFPWIRTGRLSVVKGEEGSGKTTLFHFLELVIGRNLCKKSNNLAAYLSKFNMAFRIIWLDDIHGVTFAQVRMLMPKATSRTEEYEPKGLPRCEINEVSELWFSGNQDSPLNTTAKSRRDLIFQANDTWLGKAELFNRLYAALDDFNVGKAWFTLLMNRDIRGFNPRSQQPETQVRCMVNQESMSPVHTFLTEFFVTKEWVTAVSPYSIRRIDYASSVVITESGDVSIAIVRTQLQHWLKDWMGVNMPNRKKLSSRDVTKQLREMGITAKRGVYFEDRRESFGFSYEHIKEYSMKFGVEAEPWWHVQNRQEARRILGEMIAF